MDCSAPGLPVFSLLKLAQTHVPWVSDAIQPSHPLSSPSPTAFSLSQHQGFFQWVGSLHQVARVLELQIQHQSFQWIFRVDFLWDWLVLSLFCPRDSEESSPAPPFKSIFYYRYLLLRTSYVEISEYLSWYSGGIWGRKKSSHHWSGWLFISFPGYQA